LLLKRLTPFWFRLGRLRLSMSVCRPFRLAVP
jgi:hypothetical protein